MKRATLSGVALLAVIAMAGCDGNGMTDPLYREAAGSYDAYNVSMASSTDPTISTFEGGTLTINLAADGRTTGHLHLVAFNGNPEIDADMAGTWTRTGNYVRFDQAADTFVRNMTFTLQLFPDTAAYLNGDGTFGGTRITVMLARSSPY